MYKEHETFNSPRSDAILWRYIDFTKFVSLLEKQALFFARADKLEDPFEGYLPHLTRTGVWHNLGDNPYREGKFQTWLDLTKACPRFTLINCWHESREESAAMWKLYSKNDSGIAIKTDFGSFAKSFTCAQSIFIGTISYVDYEPGFLSYNSLLCPFVYKRKSFKHEHEVRAIVQDFPLKDSEDGKHQFIDTSQEICDRGKSYQVDLSLLIQEVVVSPYAPEFLLELIGLVATRYNLKAPVVKSGLVDKPTWD